MFCVRPLISFWMHFIEPVQEHAASYVDFLKFSQQLSRELGQIALATSDSPDIQFLHLLRVIQGLFASGNSYRNHDRSVHERET